MSMRACGPTCRPMGATAPSTFTQPLAIQSSASRREHRPSSAMRLFRRVVAPAGAAGESGIGTKGEGTGTQGRQVEDPHPAVFDPDDALLLQRRERLVHALPRESDQIRELLLRD